MNDKMDSSNLLSGLNLDSKGFKQLLDTQSYVDCTLACDGGQISAHKIVLSACSSYLAKILLNHPVQHPIIILPELNIEDVTTLIYYMYTGELRKSNTLHSASLLRTAAILSVNSLNDLLNGNGAQSTSPNPYFCSTTPTTTTTTTANNNNVIVGNNNNNNNNNNNSNNNNDIDSQSSLIVQVSNGTLHNNNNINNNNIINNSTTTNKVEGLGIALGNGVYHRQQVDRSQMNINNGNTKSEFQFKCPVCHNDFQTICSFEYHMQRTHNVTSFGCEICHKPFASLRYVLTDHMRRCHGWKAEQKLHC